MQGNGCEEWALGRSLSRREEEVDGCPNPISSRVKRPFRAVRDPPLSFPYPSFVYPIARLADTPSTPSLHPGRALFMQRFAV